MLQIQVCNELISYTHIQTSALHHTFQDRVHWIVDIQVHKQWEGTVALTLLLGQSFQHKGEKREFSNGLYHFFVFELIVADMLGQGQECQ